MKPSNAGLRSPESHRVGPTHLPNLLPLRVLDVHLAVDDMDGPFHAHDDLTCRSSEGRVVKRGVAGACRGSEGDSGRARTTGVHHSGHKAAVRAQELAADGVGHAGGLLRNVRHHIPTLIADRVLVGLLKADDDRAPEQVQARPRLRYASTSRQASPAQSSRGGGSLWLSGNTAHRE